jgi:hypothetical protein
MEKALFRSTQSNTNTAFGHGNTGVVLNTNRMHYYMRYNEFTNVNAAINVPISAGGYTTAATGTVVQNGIYLTNLTVRENIFSAGGASNSYLNRAVTLSCPNSVTPAIGPGSGIGIAIVENTVSNAFRGISLSGITALSASVKDNLVQLTADNTFGTSQFGISITNSAGSPSNSAIVAISTNTLSSVGTGSLSNGLTSLLYGSLTSGVYSPSITCNSALNSHSGFHFNSDCQGLVWRCNTMENLMKGFVISGSTVVIGAQGGPGDPSNNEWLGSWTTHTQTFVDFFSDANQNPLYVQNTTVKNPTISNYGNVLSSLLYGPGQGLNITNGPTYCGGPTMDFLVTIPDTINFDSDEGYFIAVQNLYHLIDINRFLLTSDSNAARFYSTYNSSILSKFAEIEHYISTRQISTAETVLSTLTSTNNVEQNYMDFYSLYLRYIADNSLAEDGKFIDELSALMTRCPETDGSVVYQARALYNSILNSIYEISFCPPQSGAKFESSIPSLDSDVVLINLFPNPGKSDYFLECNKEIESLKIDIYDLTGRYLESKTLKTINRSTKFNINLPQGCYLIKIEVGDKSNIYKHLLIEE